MLDLEKALELTIKARTDTTASEKLEFLIKEAIAIEMARKKDCLNAFKAVKKIIEKNKKIHSYRQSLHGTWIDSTTGKQYVTNGCYVIEINKPIEGLPHLEHGVKPPFNAPQLLKDLDCSDLKEIDIDITALKVQLKQTEAETKAKGRKSISEYNVLTTLGARQYPVIQVLEIISVLGDKVEVVAGDKACLITSDTGRAFILPMFKREEGG